MPHNFFRPEVFGKPAWSEQQFRCLHLDRNPHIECGNAGVTQLVECQLPKLDVEGSSPFARSTPTPLILVLRAQEPDHLAR